MFEINIEKALKNGTLQEKINNMRREIERMNNEIKKCEKALEESKKPKLAIPFIAKKGEKYWFYASDSNIYSTERCDDNTYDVERAMVSNSFRTEEEARLAYQKRCAETELLMMCDGLEKEGNEKVWFPVLQVFCANGKPYSSIWKAISDNYDKMTPYRFSSNEYCEVAIKKLGDRKLRLIFNIPLEN